MQSTPLVSVEEAQAHAVEAVARLGGERVGLLAAHGRILAEAVQAENDLPLHPTSSMDGYAVRAADLATAEERELPVVAEVAAGHLAERPLGPGEAMAIMTGAELPDGADAVVMVEHTQRSGGQVRLRGPVAVGDYVRARGEERRAGDELLPAGTTLRAFELGLLAAEGRSVVAVVRRPVVALLSTGDELRELGRPFRRGTIVDSNGFALAALVREAGGVALQLPLVGDDPRALRAALCEAAGAADFIVSSGGVSVGEHDHMKAVLDELGAPLTLWRVAMRPGKPLALARLGDVPFFGLPGNPVSSLVTFLLFVRPALRAALGCPTPFDLPRATATLTAPLRTHGDRRAYLRAHLFFDEHGQLCATVMARQGSAMLTSFVGANGLVVVEPGRHELAAGQPVTAHVIGPLLPS